MVKKKSSKKTKKLEEKEKPGFFHRTRASAKKFRKNFHEHSVGAITAAFAFLVALSWRTPIQTSVNACIERFGLNGNAVYFEYASAVIVTLIAVLVIMLISKSEAKD